MKDVQKTREELIAETPSYQGEAFLQSIFRAVPSGIGVIVGRIIKEVNSRFCSITGYAREEMIGKNARFLYLSDEDYDYVGIEKYRQIRAHGTGTVETRMKRKDGRIIDVLLSSTPLDPADLTLGVTFTALDITERKKSELALQESKKRYAALFENMTGGVAVYEAVDQGRDFRFIAFNSSAERITCISREQAIGTPCWAFFPIWTNPA
jgi:PAS domain S-box-containing protein